MGSSFLRYQTFLVFFLFLLVNIALYVVMFQFHNVFPFGLTQQQYNLLYHFIPDERFHQTTFHFLNALAPFDAQWYLRIAAQGYPSHPKPEMSASGTYAFFPLYPLAIAGINMLFHSINLAAFVTANILLVANFWSLYYVVSCLFSKEVALKTLLLMFLFPLSIFFHSYFSESLYLLLLTWFAYFLVKKNYLLSSFFLGLLSITKGNGLLLYILFLFILTNAIKEKKISMGRALLSGLLSIVPLCLWSMYCLFAADNPFMFFAVRRYWTPNIPGLLLFFNLSLMKDVIVASIVHPFTYLGFLQIDTVCLFVIGVLLFYAKKNLRNELWWISILLWLGPLLTTTIVSFSRYQIVSFPLFIYLASVVGKKTFFTLSVLFGLGLFLSSLFFVNWYWMG